MHITDRIKFSYFDYCNGHALNIWLVSSLCHKNKGCLLQMASPRGVRKREKVNRTREDMFMKKVELYLI